MNRIVSLLLIPFFVLGQALPHSHAGSGIAEPDGHAERPHFHVSTHHHDHGNAAHSHRDHQAAGGNAIDSESVTSANEHDSDAVYLIASSDLMTLPTQSTAVGGPVANWQVGAIPLAAKSECEFRSGAPPNRYATLPIFLLTASLRL